MVKEGVEIGEAYTFEDYRLKVNRYIEQHKDETAIWKLRNNIKLTADDYQALADIFTKELGSAADYQKEFGDTPFGLLIRNYVVQNGYLENVSTLTKPPFDKPQSFVKLFAPEDQTAIITLLNLIRDNARVA